VPAFSVVETDARLADGLIVAVERDARDIAAAGILRVGKSLATLPHIAATPARIARRQGTAKLHHRAANLEVSPRRVPATVPRPAPAAGLRHVLVVAPARKCREVLKFEPAALRERKLQPATFHFEGEFE